MRPGQAPESLVYPGDDLPGTLHLAAFVGDRQMGIASFSSEPRPSGAAELPYRLRGMATRPDVRGQGVGAKLLLEGLARLESLGADWVWCNARTSAEGFYSHYGFEPVGRVFELPEIGPHRVMEYTLKGR